MATSIFCIASSESNANDTVLRLKSAGFRDSDISVLFPDKSGVRDFTPRGSLGLLAGIGLLWIAGVGPVVAAGPIKAALGGMAVGAGSGGIAGALTGMGIPEIEAKRYEGRVEDGAILISAHSESAEEIRKAKSVFEKFGATSEALLRSAARAPSFSPVEAVASRERVGV